MSTADYISRHINGQGKILDAKELVENKIEELKNRVNKLNRKPKLAIIRVGDDYASGKYVANKIKRCNEVGIESEVIHFPKDVDQMTLEFEILRLNVEDTDGILLQLPLPKHLDEDYLTNLIDPKKDVDGFTIENMGKLMLNQEGNVACTSKGIMTLLKENHIDLNGKDVLIINRSNIVGKPLSMLMLQEDATVTIAHSKTKNLETKVWNADIIITAIGKPNFFEAKDFKPGTVIIDVSINFDENGKMCGDVKKSDYNRLVEKGCKISPVPNGVGQMTVLSLIEQTVNTSDCNGSMVGNTQ